MSAGIWHSDTTEPAFDNLTYLAVSMTKTDLSVINFINQDEYWYKSATNPLAVGKTGPRKDSICAHTIASPGGILVVDDLTQVNPLFPPREKHWLDLTLSLSLLLAYQINRTHALTNFPTPRGLG